MKNIFLAAILAAASYCTAAAQITDYSIFDDKINIFVANDLGRNGYYDQKPIAELMGNMAEKGADPECVLAVGDVHHFDGVASVSDPLWTTNYELIYSHPELMISWLPVLGNHEYRGNTQAVIDYSNISRRWEMPARYYTHTINDEGTSIRIVCIDTTPLISKYRNESEKYPDAAKQDIAKQTAWLDSVLTVAKENWVIVTGHHPIYAQTTKSETERTDMQSIIDPILRRHNVDMYINGHIHNFQHIRVPGSNIDYITNSAGSLSRDVQPTQGTKFCSSATGFSILSASSTTLQLRMIDNKGNIIHTITRKK